MVYRYMAMSGRAVHKNHNLTLYYVLSYLPHNHFFLESTGVGMKLGLYIDYSERKGRTQEL